MARRGAHPQHTADRDGHLPCDIAIEVQVAEHRHNHLPPARALIPLTPHSDPEGHCCSGMRSAQTGLSCAGVAAVKYE